MRTLLSWLAEMTPLDTGLDADELAGVLSNLGLVVESMERVGEGLDGVVVARVAAIEAIEGADRIRRVVVDAGGQELGVVCGAWNFAVGDLVPLAPVGTELPGGFVISRRKMRGVVSEGMLCSGRELGLSDDADGILVLGSSPGGSDGAYPPGVELREALAIEPDVLFELEIAPNRPDALCAAGIARDLAAHFGLPFTLPDPVVVESGPPAAELAGVAIEAPELCTRLTARALTGVTVGTSPPEVARRLLLCGMRPINSVVDASNYVMLELGQPTHPYDLDRLGGGGLVARRARRGERLVTLDGVERLLAEEDCVIADAEERAIGVAGVMGGRETEISPTSSRVLLEAAHFEPLAIARTVNRLGGMRTEASVRFERGCDPEIVGLAGLRFCELLTLARRLEGLEPPTVAPGLLDARPVARRPRSIDLRVDRLNSLLGTALDAAAIAGYLGPLGFEVTSPAPVLTVGVPSFRPDVTREVDVIEEVARTHGYSSIERTRRDSPGIGHLTPHQRRRRELSRVLMGGGATEAWTSTFLSDEDHELAGLAGPAVRVANPLVSEEAVLRRSLVPGLLKAVRHNAGHRNPSLRLFEIGHVFEPPAEGGALPAEREVLGVVLAADGDDAGAAVRCWRRVSEALGIDGVSLEARARPGLHPTRSADSVAPGGEPIGTVGEIDPVVVAGFGLSHGRIGYLGLDLRPALETAGAERAAREVSRYPSSDVDLAFEVDEGTPAAAVENALAAAAGDLCESLALFDVYRGPGVDPARRSLAFRLRLCAPDRTLGDAELAEIRQRCVDAVVGSLPASLRG